MGRDFGYNHRVVQVEKRLDGLEDILASIIERMGQLEKWRIPKKILESDIVRDKMGKDRSGRPVANKT